MIERKIIAPEYAESRERMNVLRNMVIDGEDAKAVIKYADLFLEECEDKVLESVKESNEMKFTEAALEYRVASKFMDMLRHAAQIGLQKRDILERTKKHQ